MYVLIFVTVLLLVNGEDAAPSEPDVVQAFNTNGFVRAVVLNPPNKMISVTYPNVSIVLGTMVTPLQTLTQPQLSYPASDNELVTLAFLGPNFLVSTLVPPIWQFLHWLVVNIPGQDINKGNIVSIYVPPVPSIFGNLPYIFLLYKQNERLNATQIPHLSPFLSRPNFAIDEFAKRYNLVGPIAGNFMLESYMDLIPQAINVFYNVSSTGRERTFVATVGNFSNTNLSGNRLT